MAEKNQNDDPRYERVKTAKICGGSLFRLPWGMQTDTLQSHFGLGQKATMDWKKRALILEDGSTGRKNSVPFERLDFAEELSESEYQAQMKAVEK
jgi:hypothetical protein